MKTINSVKFSVFYTLFVIHMYSMPRKWQNLNIFISYIFSSSKIKIFWVFHIQSVNFEQDDKFVWENIDTSTSLNHSIQRNVFKIKNNYVQTHTLKYYMFEEPIKLALT